MSFLIKHNESGLYLTEFHLGKGILTNPNKDWTKDIDEAMNFGNKPFATIGALI